MEFVRCEWTKMSDSFEWLLREFENVILILYNSSLNNKLILIDLYILTTTLLPYFAKLK